MGEDGEIDFKEEAKFSNHMKKGEAVSDFAMSKTLAEQRQYLPIFSVREELLQVGFFSVLSVAIIYWIYKISHSILMLKIRTSNILVNQVLRFFIYLNYLWRRDGLGMFAQYYSFSFPSDQVLGC